MRSTSSTFTLKKGIVTAVLLITVAYIAWEHFADKSIETNIAYIGGHHHVLSSAVHSKVLSVHIEPGEFGKDDQVAIELDQREWERRSKMAKQKVQRITSDLQHHRDQDLALDDLLSVQARAMEHLKAGVMTAKVALRRQLELGTHTTEKEKETAKLSVSERQGVFHESEESYRSTLLKKQVNQGNVDSLLLSLEEVKSELSHLDNLRQDYTITLPNDGYVYDVHASKGSTIKAGEALITFTPKQRFWITAYFKETEVAHLSSDTRVTIKLDAYPGETFTGKVVEVSRLAGAALSPRTPNYSAGNFTRIVQRIPVKIRFDVYPAQHLAIGFSARVSVGTQ